MDQVPGTPVKIKQAEDFFKYSIDSILLSDFAEMEEGSSFADLGSGTGILALRCSYLYKTRLCYAFEIQEGPRAMLEESIQVNGLEGRIEALGDFRQGFKAKLDYIVTNPPYIEKGRALAKKNPAKHLAFHEETMDLDDIFTFARSNLKVRGRLYMVNRANRLADVIEKARAYRMEPVVLRMVHSFPRSKASFFLAEFIKDGGKNLVIRSPLIIYNRDNTYTEEVKEIYYG